MTPEAQRIAIAETCGWHECRCSEDCGHTEWYQNGIASTCQKMPPDYLNDLNAMHDAEKSLVSQDQKIEYLEQLYVLNFKGDQNPDTFIEQVFSTAAQRAEAFLKTLNLWKE